MNNTTHDTYLPRHLYIKKDGSLLIQCTKNHQFDVHFGQSVALTIANGTTIVKGAVLRKTRTGIILIGWAIENL